MAYVRRRLLKDGSKRYECCWRDPVTNRERSKTFQRRIDADHFAKLVDADLLRGVNVPRPIDSRRSLAAVVEHWFVVHSPTLKPKTAHSYRNLIDARSLSALGRVPLGKLRFTDVQGWLSDMLADGLSASRIRQAHVVLAKPLDMAARDGIIAANPARGVTLPAIAKDEQPWLEPATIEALADACEPPYRLAVRLMGYEDLRWGELVGLRRGSLDLLKRRLNVHENVVEVGGRLTAGPPKSGESRIVPILDNAPRAAHRAPHDDRRRPSHAAVHRSSGSNAAVLVAAATRWVPACEACAIDVQIHALRHSAGHALSNARVPPVVIKAFMGHASAHSASMCTATRATPTSTPRPISWPTLGTARSNAGNPLCESPRGMLAGSARDRRAKRRAN